MTASKKRKKARKLKAEVAEMAVAAETSLGDPPAEGWGHMNPHTFELEGNPIGYWDHFVLLAGTMYLIEQGKAHLHGVEIQHRFGGERTHHPFVTRFDVSSEIMPMLSEMGKLSEQAAFCERVSQWYAQQAIIITKRMETEAVKK